MGVIGKLATSRLIQPLPATVGSWVEPLLAQSDVLDRRAALDLALYRSFLGVDPGGAESSFIFSNEKRVMEITMDSRSKASVIRADTKDRRVTCAAPGHGWFTCDWTLQTNIGGSGNAEVQVVQRRTIDDSVPNSDLLKKSRSGLARVLLEGPGKIAVSKTGFELDGLVEQYNLSTKFTFYGDHLLPLPNAFHDGLRIDLPQGSAAAVRDSISTGFDPTLSLGSGRVGVSLDGGRALENCFIELVDEGDLPGLVVHILDEGAISRQRTFRAALRCLDRLSSGLGQTCPDVAASINAFIATCTEDRQSPSRFGRFLPAWGGNDPTGVILLKSGAHLPLLGRIRTTNSEGALDDFMEIAAAWVLPRERAWSQGIRQAKRDQNRHYTMRGPFQMCVNGKPQRIYRYGEYLPISLEKHCFTDQEVPWFWQVNGFYSRLEDDRVQALISVTALSRTGDIVCYGQELARFLAAFEWQVKLRDPDAEFTTVSLVV